VNSKRARRGWSLLLQLIEDGARKEGRDPDQTEDERAEELAAAADCARRLLRNTDYQALRLEGLKQLAIDFVSWLELDPGHPSYQRELVGIHVRAAPRFAELYAAEEVIHRAAEARKRLEKKEESDGGKRNGR
jgi:hypothetical protein